MKRENKKKLPKFGNLYYGHSSSVSGKKRKGRKGKGHHWDGWINYARKILGLTTN